MHSLRFPQLRSAQSPGSLPLGHKRTASGRVPAMGRLGPIRFRRHTPGLTPPRLRTPARRPIAGIATGLTPQPLEVAISSPATGCAAPPRLAVGYGYGYGYGYGSGGPIGAAVAAPFEAAGAIAAVPFEAAGATTGALTGPAYAPAPYAYGPMGYPAGGPVKGQSLVPSQTAYSMPPSEQTARPGIVGSCSIIAGNRVCSGAPAIP